MNFTTLEPISNLQDRVQQEIKWSLIPVLAWAELFKMIEGKTNRKLTV